jgi:hypothetical protein
MHNSYILSMSNNNDYDYFEPLTNNDIDSYESTDYWNSDQSSSTNEPTFTFHISSSSDELHVDSGGQEKENFLF